MRLLAPFDPLVWDRRRFELLWGWAYRFEAYTPAPKRKLGYYALPLLWRDRVIGWANLAVERGRLRPTFGHVDRAPTERPAVQARRWRLNSATCAASWRCDAAPPAGFSRSALAGGSTQVAASGFWRQPTNAPAREHRGRAREAADQAAGAVGDPADEARADDLADREDDREGGDAGRPGGGGRLCRTSAVVEATTDRKTPPNSAPDANTASGCGAQHRQRGRDREQPVQQRRAPRRRG